MSDTIYIEPDLSYLEDRLDALGDFVGAAQSEIHAVGRSVDDLRGDVETLTQDFHTYAAKQELTNRIQLAEIRLVKLRQEIEHRFGHYAEIRRMARGILEANDLAVVRQDTLRAAAEELMLRAPGYWLAPALVALAAWISDEEEVANRACAEALHRDDERTSLFFALVCRRFGRKETSLHWLQRYFAGLDGGALDRKAGIVIDAYVSGLLGRDADGLIRRRIDGWIDRFSRVYSFADAQEKRWYEAMKAMCPDPPAEGSFPYLRVHTDRSVSEALERTLSCARLYEKLSTHFQQIVAQTAPPRTLKQQLDSILERLAADFDAAEKPLHMESILEKLVIHEGGREDRARRILAEKVKAFDERRDFMQLLSDAAMHPQEMQASPALQKMALALGRDSILSAFRDIVAENRAAIPQTIKFRILAFDNETEDGSNEEKLLRLFVTWNDLKRMIRMRPYELSSQEKLFRWIWLLPVLLGLYGGEVYWTALGIAAGAVIFNAYIKAKKRMDSIHTSITEEYQKQEEEGKQMLRGVIAEIVDYRTEIARLDAESEKVIDFLQGLNPAQFIGSADGSRRVRV
ncbi:hypothetical protein [Selenomonas flueggei]|uniref:Uncharacterized protein n=1 Tax=Selenomonas flueggei ATCC 43531 TaxID=638302 RepID=C4V1Q6_9FIRM|nr:hypothetical protein [Selenomonas flueggei]EEQ49193.1 hypothetical protein HMPREF0908_0509 [Selenomonas flueggei ATCC 43531]